MEKSSLVINTAISFIIHSLEDLKNSGHEILSPLIEQIELFHKKFRESGNQEYLQSIFSYISDYKTYKGSLSNVFQKLYEVLSCILLFIKDKSLFIYEKIVLKLLELYQYILIINVKTYLRFEELEEIIRYIRDDIIRDNKRENMREELKKRTYDDVVLKILISLLAPPEEKYNSFIDLIDNILIPDKDTIDKISNSFNKIKSINKTEDKKQNLSPVELLKLKKKENTKKPQLIPEDKLQNEIESLIKDDSKPNSSVKFHTVMDDLLKDLSNETEELINNVEKNTNKFNTLELNKEIIDENPTVHHYNKQQDSPEIKKHVHIHQPDEKEVFIGTIKSNYEYESKSHRKDFSPPIIKESHENKDDKLKRILAKYSKHGRFEMDKSPPVGKNSNSMLKILSDRKQHDIYH